MVNMSEYRIDTKCIQEGYSPKNREPRVLPIVQSTTYTYDSSQAMGDLFDLKADGFFYTRLANPTLDAVERKSPRWKAAWAPCSPLPDRLLP